MTSASADIEEFLSGPLIAWLTSCLHESNKIIDYPSLWDGSILYSVLLQIDPEPAHPINKLDVNDELLIATRINNFHNIFKNLKTLYDEEFRQTIILVPDFLELGTKPDSKTGLENMKLLILLLLGAAVQCPNRKTFIQNIYDLDITVQHAIKDCITQVIESQTIVLTNECEESAPAAAAVVSNPLVQKQLLNLVKERDKFFSYYMTCILAESFNAGGGGDKAMNAFGVKNSVPGMDSNHHAVELADWKAKLRRQRQELEEKSELIMEYKEELEYTQKKLEKLRAESQEWFQASCRASAYRDEVDALRERCDHADRLEVEVQKLRDRINDDEFYKNRVEELREDNKNLSETIEMLEEQLTRARKRSDQALSLETEIIKYKQRINDLVLQKDADHNKLQDLIEENTQLELLTKSVMSDVCNTSTNSNDSGPGRDYLTADNSLIDQLKTNAEARVLKLELENKQLLSKIDDMHTFNNESSNKIVDTEKERKKLSMKCGQLSENCNRLTEQNKEMETMFKNAMDENKKIMNELDNNKALIDKITIERETEKKRIVELEKSLDNFVKEKQSVQRVNECVQRKNDELEKALVFKSNECASLMEKVIATETSQGTIMQLNEKITKLEKENQMLSKDMLKLRAFVEEKDVLLDKNAVYIEECNQEVERLSKQLQEHQTIITKLEDMKKKMQELESQSNTTDEIITTLQKDLVSEKLNIEKMCMLFDKLGLGMNDILKTDNCLEYCIERILTFPDNQDAVKQTISKVNKENPLLLCDGSCNKGKLDPTVLSSLSSSNKPNNELVEQTESTTTELSILKTVNSKIRKENAIYKVDLATLNSQISSLQAQQLALQIANSQLLAEKEDIVKEFQQCRLKNKSISQDLETLQHLHEQLTMEYETVTRERESTRNILRDLKAENRELSDKFASNEKEIKRLLEENSSLKLDTHSLVNLRLEHSNLKEDFKHLFTASDKLKTEYRNMQEQYRLVRSESHRQKLQYTELTGELNNRRDLITSLQLELHKVSQYCEMLLQRNSCLDSDRRILMEQVSKLLSQYHELLAHSIEDNKHYHDEEKLFTDKVNSLCRQKEKLEEKIMEHYKKLESCSSKRKAFGSNLVHRVCKAGSDLMKKVPSRNRHSWTDDSHVLSSTFLERSGQGETFSEAAIDNSGENQSLETQSSSLDMNDSLCLGSAGTRRTVYLTEEPEPERSSPVPSNSTIIPPPQSNTFLVYNKITTLIGKQDGSGTSTNPDDNNKSPTTGKTTETNENKESAVWYEYGCV